MGFECPQCGFDLWDEYYLLTDSEKLESKHIVISNVRTTSTVDYMNGIDWDVNCTCPRCKMTWTTSDGNYQQKARTDVIAALIQQAKDMYPLSLMFKGNLSEKEYKELEKVCDIRCPSTYMDGSATFCIRYRGGDKK